MNEHTPPPSDLQTAEEWDARYVQGAPPWELGRVHRQLEPTLRAHDIQPCRALEVGCGTGRDSVWLAARGFTVTAVDVAAHAITQARAHAAAVGVDVDFRVGTIPAALAPCGLVYDCGCFHTQLTPAARAAFAASVAARLAAGGRWLSIMGSTDGPPRDHGPPRLSARDVALAVEPSFELLSLQSDIYDADVPTPARAWVMVARRRDEPT